MIETTNAKLKKWQSGDSVQACFDALNQNADILDAIAASVKKYPNGRMELYQSWSVNTPIQTAWSNFGLSYVEFERDFSQAFFAAPEHVQVTPEMSSSTWAWAIVTKTTATKVSVALIRPGSIAASVPYKIHVMAIGRWK